MTYRFRPGLHACDLKDALVLLDLQGDRYLALGPASRSHCLRLLKGADALQTDNRVVSDLMAAGLLVPAEPGVRCMEVGPKIPPARSSADAKMPSAAFAVAMALARSLAASAELELWPLSTVLSRLASRKQRGHPLHAGRQAATRVASVFATADRLLSPTGRCLPRSIAIARALMAAGVRPNLVIGVKLYPFEAHCWVQHGDVLVGDELSSVEPFKAIFSL